FEVEGHGEDWHLVAPKKPTVFDLDDFPGVIIGRQAISHSDEKNPAALGLDPPLAVATLCAGDPPECRDFRFGKVEAKGVTHYYAQAPDSDPVELRDNDWKLIVDGPFVGRRK